MRNLAIALAAKKKKHRIVSPEMQPKDQENEVPEQFFDGDEAIEEAEMPEMDDSFLSQDPPEEEKPRGSVSRAMKRIRAARSSG